MPFNKVGFRDILEKDSGLIKQNANSKEIVVRKNLIFVDTRDCVGIKSLTDSQYVFEGRGGRPFASGFIRSTSGDLISPITITIDTTTEEKRLKHNDTIYISGVLGNLNANGRHEIKNPVGNTFTLSNTVGNGNYNGGGLWNKPADPGYPLMTQADSTIVNNILRVNFTNKKLKVVRSISLENCVIPRDIIPITSYIPDFIQLCVMQLNTLTDCSLDSSYVTYIPQEDQFMQKNILGFYSTPVEFFRTYINGTYSFPSGVTPPPFKLWNPPVGLWPLQPKPYPFQGVPTYKSNEFTLPNEIGTYYLILSGYGIYDLVDWSISIPVVIPEPPFLIDIGITITELARKLLLLLITPAQSYRNKDTIELIFNTNVTDSAIFPFGFGDFQRFIPGPGLQQNYQPGTSDNANPTIPGLTWPVSFPNFRGNVWGPYDAPGDRFQYVGLRQTIQDLYLNGDLRNLNGDPIIKQDVPTECLMEDNSFGLNFNCINTIRISNLEEAVNLNILNAMRIVPNGFGALTVRANGFGTANYINQYNPGSTGPAGGIGPDVNGIAPTGGAWADNPLGSATGTESFGNPIASGPTASFTTTLVSIGPGPSDVDATISGSEMFPTDPRIKNRVSYYDLGVNKGSLKDIFINWKVNAVNEIPDTNLVMNVLQSQRNERTQGTNTKSYASMLSLPIRLSLGTTTGTINYVENLSSMLSDSSYWYQRFLNPIARLDRFEIQFTTYDGGVIPLESMLLERRPIDFIRSFERIFGSSNIFNSNFEPLYYLFNPLDPRLIGRMKRNMSLIFAIETYEYTNPGLDYNIVKEMIDSNYEFIEDSDEFNVKASNYEEYR